MATNLKPASIVAVVVLIILTPAIQNELRDKAATYVNDSESSHDGLPDSWDNQQVLCVIFPTEAPHSEFATGVTMIETEGHDHRRDLNHLLHVAAVKKTNMVPP